MQDLYSSFGASSGKEDVHAAIKNLDKGIAPGAFCKVLPDILGKDANFLNVMHADGAGTKSILAYLQWRETGDLAVWKGIAQDALVMNIDDLLCVGATKDFVVTSTLGRNKRLIPAEVIKAIIEGTEEFCATLRELGIPIFFAGGETADVGDLVKTILVDSNVSCRFEKENLITASNIQAGNAIIGIPSDGQTTYESCWNSGIASNGITLARHVLLNHHYGTEYPESIDQWFAEKGGYKGNHLLSANILQHNRTLGEALLSPTRTFAPILDQILKNTPKTSITGIIHNTGGGHSKVKNFIGNVEVEKNVNWTVPEIFRLIQKETNMEEKELFQTFNSGIRMEIYCDPKVVPEILEIIKSFGLNGFEIGRVNSSNHPNVRIRSGHQEWSY
jgi:phosphoribosylformylglycinamidine cyclo-ligase